MKIRRFKKSDADQIARLFHDTVRQINIRDYTDRQVRAWAPDNIYFRDWKTTCSQKITFVAEDQGVVTGFAELEENGHIDCFYCHRSYQQQGIGKLLFQALEKEAREQKIRRLYAEVSITAKPFFTRMGFSEIKRQNVIRGEIKFTNYVMDKNLKPDV